MGIGEFSQTNLLLKMLQIILQLDNMALDRLMNVFSQCNSLFSMRETSDEAFSDAVKETGHLLGLHLGALAQQLVDAVEGGVGGGLVKAILLLDLGETPLHFIRKGNDS